jgi:hypothetical protein
MSYIEENYKEVNGLWYHEDTKVGVIQVIEHCRKYDIRVVIDYGNVDTGESWGEIHDIKGRFGKTNGTKPIIILAYNKRCYGGGAVLTHCILSIKESKGGRFLYNINGDSK